MGGNSSKKKFPSICPAYFNTVNHFISGKDQGFDHSIVPKNIDIERKVYRSNLHNELNSEKIISSCEGILTDFSSDVILAANQKTIYQSLIYSLVYDFDKKVVGTSKTDYLKNSNEMICKLLGFKETNGYPTSDLDKNANNAFRSTTRLSSTKSEKKAINSVITLDRKTYKKLQSITVPSSSKMINRGDNFTYNKNFTFKDDDVEANQVPDSSSVSPASKNNNATINYNKLSGVKQKPSMKELVEKAKAYDLKDEKSVAVDYSLHSINLQRPKFENTYYNKYKMSKQYKAKKLKKKSIDNNNIFKINLKDLIREANLKKQGEKESARSRGPKGMENMSFIECIDKFLEFDRSCISRKQEPRKIIKYNRSQYSYFNEKLIDFPSIRKEREISYINHTNNDKQTEEISSTINYNNINSNSNFILTKEDHRNSDSLNNKIEIDEENLLNQIGSDSEEYVSAHSDEQYK